MKKNLSIERKVCGETKKDLSDYRLAELQDNPSGDLGNVEVKMGQIIQGLSKERLGKIGAQKGH